MGVRRWAKTGGWALVVAGVLGAAAAAFLMVVPPAVTEDRFSFPLTASGYVVIQVSFFLHHLLVVWGLWAFWRAGLAGRGVLAAIGGIAASATMAALSVQELITAGAAEATYPSPQTDAIEGVYGVITLAAGAALVVLGIASLRARVLPGAGRFVMLILGVFVFVPLTPGIFGPFLVARLVIGVWLLLFAWLGVVMIRWAAAGASASSVPTALTRT